MNVKESKICPVYLSNIKKNLFVNERIGETGKLWAMFRQRRSLSDIFCAFNVPENVGRVRVERRPRNNRDYRNIVASLWKKRHLRAPTKALACFLASHTFPCNDQKYMYI